MPKHADFAHASPLSLIIGVTGHRDLREADVPRLESALASAFLDIHHRYPASSAVLLSSLAEGADRLAARIALQSGMQLVVPLPLPRALYEQDFETAASRQDFNDLIDRASGVIDLPLLLGVAERDVERYGLERDREYAKAGAYIARHSQIFFALWDGSVDETDKVGGTAQTVRFRLEGAPAPYASRHGRLVSPAAFGPVLHVETPRQTTAPHTALSCGAIHLLLPSGTTAASFDQTCRRMDGFNADARRFSGELERTVETSKIQLVNATVESFPPLLDALPVSCRRLMEQYAVADALALHFRTNALSTWKYVSIGVAVAAFFFNVHSSFFSVQTSPPASVPEAVWEMPWFLLAFLLWSAFTAIWLYRKSRKGEYQTKYQDYRALAEALRIRFFWRLAGVSEPVVDSYLRKQRSELEWIRSALLSCDVWVAAAGSVDEGTLAPRQRLGLVAEWIHEQRRYFTTKAKTETTKLEEEARIIEWLLKGSGVLSGVLAALLALPLAFAIRPFAGLMKVVPNFWQHGLFMVAIPMLAVVAGLLHGYGKQLARSEHIRQFGRMSQLFYAAEMELEALLAEKRMDTAAELIRELGLEALDENGDWLILHRERPLEVPPG